MNLSQLRELTEAAALARACEATLRHLLERIARLEARNGVTLDTAENATILALERRIVELERRPRGPGRPRGNGKAD
jgi:hypothetical protein